MWRLLLPTFTASDFSGGGSCETGVSQRPPLSVRGIHRPQIGEAKFGASPPIPTSPHQVGKWWGRWGHILTPTPPSYGVWGVVGKAWWGVSRWGRCRASARRRVRVAHISRRD